MAFTPNYPWPANTNLQSLTLRGQSVRFEPLLENDFSSVTSVIAEHFIPDEPLNRAAGADLALLSAKKNPESAESAEFWRQTRSFVDSFIAPAFTSRPNVSFKVVTTEKSSSAAEEHQVIIGLALAHMEYLKLNENFTHSVYVIELYRSRNILVLVRKIA